jgi:hypothetical protein
VASSAACEASEAIRKFSEFLGGNKMEFAAVCSLIASELVGGTPLPMLRNALAHGNADVLSRLREGAFSDLRSLLFEPPRQVIPRILAISAKAGGPASSSGM